eukprot:COSAG02_NODE_22103_length_763_cov_1.147590_1_plen_94_part_00
MVARLSELQVALLERFEPGCLRIALPLRRRQIITSDNLNDSASAVHLERSPCPSATTTASRFLIRILFLCLHDFVDINFVQPATPQQTATNIT